MTVDRLRGDALQPAWLLYVDCDPAVRIWTGPANFKLGPATGGPDTAGGIYRGLGLLVAVPNLVLPQNGNYKAHTFQISGVTAEAMRLINADRDTVRGARLCFARLEIDDDGNPVDMPTWLFTSFVDSPRVDRVGSTKPPTRMIGLVASTGVVRRGVRRFSYYTPSQQALRDPADTSCMNVPLYAAGTTVIFPS